ncbi:MAG TPA: acetate/propionate family kinase [Gammaproteobacteria bacterium]|nr:acetate/propionate family kinase [Gammaproteobacteria bacterium]
MTRSPGLVLAFNAGSSSLKFEVFAADGSLETRVRGAVRDLGRPHCAFHADGAAAQTLGAGLGPAEAAAYVLRRLFDGGFGAEVRPDRVRATAHRIVHGGPRFAAPVRVTAGIEDRLRALGEIAPLHNPPAIAVMDAVRAAFRDVPAVAVFDTAFFRTLPAHARVYAIPAAWRERFGIERYGFHGIAHEYLCGRVTELAGRAPRRVLSLQLGQGCSIAALADGRPVDTSMGFTPLEGLVMGTRPGDLDAGAVVHLARHGVDVQALDEGLNRASGLLALSGATDDMRELLALEAQGHGGAGLAIAAFCHRLCKYIGAYAAVLGGVDAIAFGGGIGEHAPSIRARVCRRLEWLGVELDEAANERAIGTEATLSAARSRVAVFCIPVREEQIIARAALAILSDTEEGA